MLSYIFWHWPKEGVVRSAYESDLADFHRALSKVKPEGFQHSVVFRVRGASWLPQGSPAYEDWYLLEGSCALDALNTAAVTGDCQEPHDRVARVAAGGTAGLYRLRAGEPQVAGARFASWFAKPAGVHYADFYAQLRPWSERAGVSLWGRQMTLGPTAEFCLCSPQQLELPANLGALSRRLECLWP